MIFVVSDSGIPNDSGQNSPTEPSQFHVNFVRTTSRTCHQETPQSLRKREVALAKISLYIVLVFLLCHIIRIIPNAYEMIQSYNLGVSILVSIIFLHTWEILEMSETYRICDNKRHQLPWYCGLNSIAFQAP